MQVLVAPDKFKGSLTASAAAEAIRTGLLQALPDAEVVLAPVADGGDGTVDAAVAAGYERVPATVAGPTGEQVAATFALSGDTAVVDMAEASGLRRLTDLEPDLERCQHAAAPVLTSLARRLAEASALLGAGSAAADSRTSATAHAAHRQQPD